MQPALALLDNCVEAAVSSGRMRLGQHSLRSDADAAATVSVMSLSFVFRPAARACQCQHGAARMKTNLIPMRADNRPRGGGIGRRGAMRGGGAKIADGNRVQAVGRARSGSLLSPSVARRTAKNVRPSGFVWRESAVCIRPACAKNQAPRTATSNDGSWRWLT